MSFLYSPAFISATEMRAVMNNEFYNPRLEATQGMQADSKTRPRHRNCARSAHWLGGYVNPIWLVWVTFTASVVLVSVETTGAQQIVFRTPSENQSISIQGQSARNWTEGSYEVWQLDGKVILKQGSTVATSNHAVAWVERSNDTQVPSKVIIYLEEKVEVQLDAPDDRADSKTRGAKSSNRLVDQKWHGRFYSSNKIDIVAPTIGGRSDLEPAIVKRARTAVFNLPEPTNRLVQFQQPNSEPIFTGPLPENFDQTRGSQPTGSLDGLPFVDGNPQFQVPQPQGRAVMSPQLPQQPLGPAPTRPQSQTTVTITGRNGAPPNSKSFTSPGGVEQVTLVTGGVRIELESSELASLQGFQLGKKIAIEADRAIAWTASFSDLQGGNSPGRQQWQFYIEGNIVFVAGERVIYADRMFYDALNSRGTILNAEMLTTVPDYDGLVRLKADVLQQLNENQFQARGAAITSSRMGVPRYWVQSDDIMIQRTPKLGNVLDPNNPFQNSIGQDSVVTQPDDEAEYLATSRRNWLYVGGVPLLFWPQLQTDLKKPTFYLDRLSIKNDSVYGFQLLTDWDLYQVLRLKQPKGTEWTLALDLLTDRGFGFGTTYKYDRDSFFGIQGPAKGKTETWAIYDNGLDNLGADRRAVTPEENFRRRQRFEHKQRFGIGYELNLEVGYISDRNFLEQYYEHEWDEGKDEITGLHLKRFFGSQSVALSTDVRLNDFFTQTNWLPRLDHFLLGQNIGDRFTWFSHSHVGYGQVKTADAPTNAVDLAKFDPLAWESEVEGLRIGTRQEIDFPVQVGSTKVVPYVLGDLTYWGEDIAGDSITRAYGQLGMRASLPMYRADPTVINPLFNLNGLAHKVIFDADVYWSDASRNVDQLALFDPLDDDAQEAFRRRFFFDTFGGVGTDAPLQFDERFYAVRNGMQGYVASPVSEIADDLMAAKFGVHQRWQTKRGLPGQQRIVDWMTFDVEATFFPKANRDNFGADVGLLDYDFRWHLGDRVTVLSDGFFDFFGQGLRTASIGTLFDRPDVGNFYVGFRSIEGPISSNVLSTRLAYRMSEKWALTAGSSIDFGEAGNLGQSLAVTRIGESFLVRVGINADISRDNVGAIFQIEPRFLPSNKLNSLRGIRLPPLGSRGLE